MSTISNGADHGWDEVLSCLGDMLKQNPDLVRESPHLTSPIDRLMRDLNNGATLADDWFRTRLAYAVADLENATTHRLSLSPAIRSELDRLAVSSPGLNNPELAHLLRQTSKLDPRDSALYYVRSAAREFVVSGPDGEDGRLPERIRTLEKQVYAGLVTSGRMNVQNVPAHVILNDALSRAAIETAGLQGRSVQEQRIQQTSPQVRAESPVPTASHQTSSDIPPEIAARLTIADRAATGLASVATQVIDAVASKIASSPPPWQGATQALSGRMAAYQQAQADTVSATLYKHVEVAAAAATEALKKIEAGPAADLLRRIGDKAIKNPTGWTGVIEQMRPGGIHAALRNELNTLFAENRPFAAAYDHACATVSDYVTSRDELAADYRKRGFNPDDLNKRLRAFDAPIIEGARKLPGRHSGRALIDELAECAMRMAKNLAEQLKIFFKAAAGSHPQLGNLQARAEGRGPSLSPSP